MNLPWFRFYSEFSGDPVVQSLAFEDQRHYVMLLCLKCNGTLDRELPPGRRDGIILRGLGLDAVAGSEAKRRLMDVGLVNKSWQPIGWDKRQFRSDSSTERTRKYRKENESRNVSETSPKRHENVTVTPRTEQNRTDIETDKETTTVEPPTDAVQVVFDHWRQHLSHQRAVLTPERRRKIKSALEHYTPDQLCRAIDGCAVTPHNMGENERGEKYDDIALIVRDAAHIERFMRNADSPPKSRSNSNASGNLARAAEAIRRSHEPNIAGGGGARTVPVSGAATRPSAAPGGSAVHDSGDGRGLAHPRAAGRGRPEGG